jgi:hypothetical protein
MRPLLRPRTTLLAVTIAAIAASIPAPASAATNLPTGRIASSIGRQSTAPFEISTALIPNDIARSRYIEVARVTGRRWGLTYQSTTRRRTDFGDGRNTVGFGNNLPRGVLGVTTVGVTGSGFGRRVVERDVKLTRAVTWEEGPAYPTGREFDLQTVLLHELGHFAGNGRHAQPCTNTPMVESFRPGDWWRTLSWSRMCGVRASSKAAPGRMILRIVEL